MELSEIEAQADALLERLASTSSAGEVRDICFRLDGLKNAAQIKSTVAFRKEREAVAPLPLWGALPAVPGFVRCPATKLQGGWTYRCESVAGHTPAGAHDWRGSPNPPDEEPTKPAVDRLHELVSYGEQMEASNRTVEYPCPDAADAYQDMASKLEEILREGEL